VLILLNEKLKMNRREASVDAERVFEDPTGCWDGKGFEEKKATEGEEKG
jgi:hypothetical protein